MRSSSAPSIPERLNGHDNGCPPVSLARSTNEDILTRTCGPVSPCLATMARLRWSPARSKDRPWSPLIHFETPCLLTPCLRAAFSCDTPVQTSVAAPRMLSTELTLPGSTSQGMTRSLAPQRAHRASRIRMRRYPCAVCSPLSTEDFVTCNSSVPHRKQTQPSRTDEDQSPLVKTCSYRIESMASTWTTRTLQRPMSGRRQTFYPRGPFLLPVVCLGVYLLRLD